MIVRLALLLLFGFIAWRVLRPLLLALQQRSAAPPAQAPPPGFIPDTDPLVRCEQCGIRVPASQVAAIRANCKQCSP